MGINGYFFQYGCDVVDQSCMSDVVADSEFRVQALILSPTREIASQTEKVSLVIGNYYINLQAHACVEGKSMGEDTRKLEYGVHVVVLISITLPNEILKFKSKFVTDHIGMHVKRDELTFEGIKQFCAPIENGEWKSDTMRNVRDLFTINEAVIFCNTNQKTMETLFEDIDLLLLGKEVTNCCKMGPICSCSCPVSWF